jgi:uncharacterized membrane protein YfcA
MNQWLLRPLIEACAIVCGIFVATLAVYVLTDHGDPSRLIRATWDLFLVLAAGVFITLVIGRLIARRFPPKT